MVILAHLIEAPTPAHVSKRLFRRYRLDQMMWPHLTCPGLPRNSNYSPEVITEARPNKGQVLLRQHAQDAQLGLDTTGSPRSLPVLLLRQPYPNRGPEQSGNYFGLTCIPVELKLMQCQIEKGRRIRSGDNITCNRKQESERIIRRMFPAHSLGSSGAQGLLARYHAESV